MPGAGRGEGVLLPGNLLEGGVLLPGLLPGRVVGEGGVLPVEGGVWQELGRRKVLPGGGGRKEDSSLGRKRETRNKL